MAVDLAVAGGVTLARRVIRQGFDFVVDRVEGGVFLRAGRWISAAGVGVVLLSLGAGVALAAPGSPGRVVSPPVQRLDRRQWASYEQARKRFARTTTKTVAVFRLCTSSVFLGGDIPLVAFCFGDAATVELPVSEPLEGVVEGLARTTPLEGCTNAIGQLAIDLVPWSAAVVNVRDDLRAAEVPGADSTAVTDIDNAATDALRAIQNVNRSARRFRRACAPR